MLRGKTSRGSHPGRRADRLVMLAATRCRWEASSRARSGDVSVVTTTPSSTSSADHPRVPGQLDERAGREPAGHDDGGPGAVCATRAAPRLLGSAGRGRGPVVPALRVDRGPRDGPGASRGAAARGEVCRDEDWLPPPTPVARATSSTAGPAAATGPAASRQRVSEPCALIPSPRSSTAARPASSRAIGTRGGEQET